MTDKRASKNNPKGLKTEKDVLRHPTEMTNRPYIQETKPKKLKTEIDAQRHIQPQ